MGRSSWASVSRFAFTLVFFALLAAASWAQRTSQPLITQKVDDTQLTRLRGNTYPLAQRQFDQGAAPAGMPMHRMLLVLQRSPQQEHNLVTLIDSQQDKSSPNYHKWLTPDEFGQQFGPSDADVQTVTAWLQLHGFQVTRVSQGRTIIEFDGTAGQVQQAFHTAIHSYLVNGEQHWANASDPQIPAALAPVVAGPVSLHNFPRKPLSQFAGIFSKSKTSAKATPVNPQFTFPGQCLQDGNCYAVGPYDFATIYNVLPLWNATIDGTGQTIAIVGQTNINIQDVRDFRALFGLPAKDPNIILNGPDPGINGDEGEADIDVQWSGAVARNATIDFVVSESTETTAGIDLSAEYIIDNNLAPVMSESYGACELAFGTAGNAFYSALWEQAAAQGITVMVSSGDSGSAGCDVGATAAQYGLAVNGIASTPFNVAVGGTDFNDFSNPQTYWSTVNDPTTQASAIGYIPETTWNDTCTNAIFGTIGYSTNPETNCNDSTLISYGLVNTVAGSGGVSNCTTNSQQPGTCSGGYAKPSWQTGFGTGSTRNLPDVSLFASNGFVGNFYVVCQSDSSPTGTCDLNFPYMDFAGYGGTSVASPAFAGIMALVNQQTGTRQGNANYVLYKLATSQPSSFHDVTSGTIAVPCLRGTTNCTTSVSSHQYGVLSGFSTGVGYDAATGLGTVNAANLVNNWSSVTFTPSTTTLSLTPTTGITHGQSVSVSATVTPSLAKGDVSLLTSTGKSVDGFTLANGQITGSTTALPGGTYTVHAHYSGDGTYASSDSSPVSVTVAKENSLTALSLITFTATGNILNAHATTAVYGSPYLLRVDVTPSSGTACTNCPSGTLALTDNSSPLDGGAFVLNNLGYAEDQLVQFPGGNNAVAASYPGDNSFNASSTSATYTITPAATTITTVNNSTITVGVPVQLSTTVQTQSSGLAPTGTVTFLANGTQLPGTVTYTPTAGSFNAPASLLASISTTVSSPGTYSLTTSYSGDSNYSGSSSSGTSVSVKYPMPSVSVSPTSSTVQPGTNVTLTALVDTTNKSVYPTGTVTFRDVVTQAMLPGSVTLTQTTDGSGNFALQATLTFSAQVNQTIEAQYSGDQNYPASNSFSVASIAVSGNDFSLTLTPASATLLPGKSANATLYVAVQSGYTGSVTFNPQSCSGLPAESACFFNPTTITGAGYTVLSITTTAPHAIGKRAANSLGRWVTGLAPMAFGIFLIGGTRRRRWSYLLGLVMVGLLLLLPACGGGSSSSSGGGAMDPGTPPGTYSVVVTGTSGSLTHTTTLTLTVQ